ncbi:MAG TPA: glycosyltransferase [bacterium]|nr:glycosyltransferase [bacterium]
MRTHSPKPLSFLILSSKGGGTGCALRARYIAEALSKKGHEVHFIKPIPSLPFWLDMVLSKPYYFLKSLPLKVDVAMAIKPYPTVVPALWVQRWKGAKVILDVDDLDYDYSRGWFKRLHKWLQLPWPKWADLVTYHNPHLLEPIREVFRVPSGKLVQLPQGVDTALFSPKPVNPHHLPNPAAALYKDKSARPLLVFTAHLNVACDLEPVLRSFQITLKSLPGAKLLVAGGGPDEGRFKRMAADLGLAHSVHFTGYLSPRQVAACLGIADASLVYYSDLPVNKNRASMKLRESLASGCRVVATEVGEMGLFRGAAFLSRPDPGHFAQAILRALASKKNPRPAALLVKKWDWTDCVKDLEAEVHQITGR